MGQFRIEVTSVGGHGCQREVKDGGTVYGCGLMNCPDCLAAKFVADLKRSGAHVERATLTHWPGQESEVVDEFDVGQGLAGHTTLAKRARRGSF